jgi:hypothetical protein
MLGFRFPRSSSRGLYSRPDLGSLHQEGDTWVSPRAHFGGSPFPAYSNGTMATVGALLRAHGIPNVHLTDDIFICGATAEECWANLNRAVAILRKLGWRLQQEKIIPPSQRLPFLGIMIDTIECRLSIPQDKLASYLRSIRRRLQEHADTGHVHASDLESDVGKLGWVSEVMVAGKARLYALRKALPQGWHRHRHRAAAVVLSAEALADLQWWEHYLSHSQDNPLWVPFWTQEPPVHCRTYSDASGDTGFGLILGDQVYQGLWAHTPAILEQSSGYKELIPVLMALLHLPAEANGKIVVVTTDNMSNVISINKGACRSQQSARVLDLIMDLAASRQIYLIGDWCPREELELLDEISKEPWSSGHLVLYA